MVNIVTQIGRRFIDLSEGVRPSCPEPVVPKLLFLKPQAIMKSTALAVCSVNCYRQRSSVGGPDSMNLLYDLSVLFPRVVKCLASNSRGGRNIPHSLSYRHDDFFPVRPRQRCLERLTVCTSQIEFACAIECECQCEAPERGPRIERRFRGVQLPSPSERCDVPGLCHDDSGGPEQQGQPHEERMVFSQFKFS